MSELKFACPHCQQHIQCDLGYAGMEIACPTCSQKMVVPLGAGGAAPPPPPLPPTVVAATACPSCGAPLTPAAIMCTACGYNVRTGQRLQPRAPAPARTAGPLARPGAAARAPKPAGPTKWYATAYPYAGFVLAVLGVLYFLGQSNPLFKLAFYGGAALYIGAVHILVCAFAFKEDVGAGFMCLCLPFYASRWVFKQSGSTFLQVFYASENIVVIALALIFFVFNE